MMMRRTLLILFLAVLSVCCTFAMVPRHRLARSADNNICAPHTPCSWAVYRTPSKEITVHVENTYCVCAEGTVCDQDEDDVTASAYVYKCKAKNT